MVGLFCLVFVILIVMELTKGLSANGTPPVLQSYDWQLDLAHFMWSNIAVIRSVLVVALILIAWAALPGATPGATVALIVSTVIFGAIWGFVYWLFNLFWVGKYKFLPITQKIFAKAADNKVDPKIQVIGVDLDGVQKAYPANMLFYHHQITDEIAGHPIWATYCGLCRSGRVYDLNVGGQSMEFGLVGAITFNAVFRDVATGSWWRQETGEAVKGPMAGKQLDDVAFEQMSLENWLAKYPDSEVLQYDPVFEQKYNFTAKLMSYEVSLPGWHRHETPPLVIGIEVDGHPHAYDFDQLKKRRMVQDELAGTPLLVVCDADGSSGFVYERNLDGEPAEFDLEDGVLKDSATGSAWDDFGRCVEGKLKGAALRQIQSYQQFVRAWISFHPGTTFYNF